MASEGHGGAAGAAPRRIRLGMVGGGAGAFIGAVHRIAARLDDRYELVAGALASDPERARASGRELGLAPGRAYGSFVEMAAGEAALDPAARVEAVSIVTPNHVHFPAAKAFLEAGFDVICDKPMTTTVEEAESLADLIRRTGRLFAVTYNYTGYPMVRHAREVVRAGELGDVRVVQVEYPQGWLTERLEATGQKQAAWRTDPARSGAGGCIGDIGTHAFHLAGFVTGLTLDTVSAELTTFVGGRALDDNAHLLLRYAGGARGMLWASQVAPGHENGLRLRVYGSKGGLEWVQADPNYLWVTPLGRERRVVTRGGDGAGPAAARVTRLPFGHPEGYLEAFATIYSEVALALRARREGRPVPDGVLFPTVEDGLEGVRFVAAALRSSRANGAWTGLAA